MIHLMSCRTPCRFHIHILRWSLKRSVKQWSRTGSVFSTNESAIVTGSQSRVQSGPKISEIVDGVGVDGWKVKSHGPAPHPSTARGNKWMVSSSSSSFSVVIFWRGFFLYLIWLVGCPNWKCPACGYVIRSAVLILSFWTASRNEHTIWPAYNQMMRLS